VKRPLVWVTAAALASKGLVLAALHDHPLLRPEAGLDTGAYVSLARTIASGDLLLRSLPEPFFVSPLYAYFLALVLAVTGSLLACQVVQVLLGAAAVWLAGDAARRLFGPPAAVPAALLLALTGVVTFHEVLLLQAALDAFLTAAALWALARALAEGERPRAFCVAGLLLGLLALNRPNALPWAAVVVGLLVVIKPRSPRAAAAFALGAALGIAPAALRNLVVSGEPVLISSHGGLNLLIGNGPEAAGVYRLLDGITPAIEGQSADARRVAEKEEGRALSTREVSSHFARRAFGWIASQPGQAARLFARKLWYTLSNDEAPLNFSYPWYRVRTLALWPLLVGPWLLVPLGAVGLVFGLRGASTLPVGRFALWASFAPCYVLLVAAFFVATRYRIPLLVALAIAAGGAVPLLGDRPRRVLAAAVAVPLLALTLWPTRLDDGSAEEETQWILHLVASGESKEAWQRTEGLAGKAPLPGVLWFRLGQALGASGRLDDGLAALERSLAIDARQPAIEKALGSALAAKGNELLQAGQATAAVAPLARAASLIPLDGEVRQSYGLALAMAGKKAEAEAQLAEAVRLLPSSAPARVNLAALLAEKGDLARARELAREALAMQPGYAKAAALLEALK